MKTILEEMRKKIDGYSRSVQNLHEHLTQMKKYIGTAVRILSTKTPPMQLPATEEYFQTLFVEIMSNKKDYGPNGWWDLGIVTSATKLLLDQTQNHQIN